MKRLINNGDIFDKYVSFEDKKFRDETIKQLNWQGHRNIAGTYRGAAYSTSLADNYMANNLRNDSNPKGSLLQAAKNYTDEKVATAGKTLHAHYIRLASPDAEIFFTYISEQAEAYTIETLKQVLNNKTKTIPCSGYWSTRPVVCFFGNGSNYFQLGTVQDKTIKFVSQDFIAIDDYVA